MKKIIAIFLLLTISTAFALSYATKCKMCLKNTNKSRHIGIACRDFGTPHIRKDGKVYVTYKCEYGHKYLVEIKQKEE